MLGRLVLLSSTAVCFLLSIAVYARLTGYDLGYSGVVSERLPQSLLFFGFLNLTLLLAAAALARTALSQGYSIASCTAHAIGSGALLTGAILATCWLLDGRIDDLAQFMRFEVARASTVTAPVLAALSYLLARRWSAARLPSVDAARWLKAGLVLSVGLAALAAAFYLWDRLRPWPDPMPEQLLVVTCGLMGPAFVLAVLSASVRDLARIGSACGVAGLTLIAALL
jgi:hypothetical protein